MKQVSLIRDRDTGEALYGRLVMDGVSLCDTLEQPWRDNQPRISCIPTGTYYVTKWNSKKYPDVWHVTNVPKREAILIHNGNVVADTEGCILVGLGRGKLGKFNAVLNSIKALVGLRKVLPKEFMLEVRYA